MRKSLHSEDLKVFCKVMADARKKAGLTQQKLASRLKRPQSFVAKYERGERRIDVVEFIAIAAAIDTDPVRLLKRIIQRKT